MTILRACVTCGKPSRASYCPEHQPKPWATSTRKQRTTLSGSAEQARRLRILARDLGTCHVCGKLGADEVDHRVALGEGGADTEWNLASIHAEPCHREKTAAEAVRARQRGGGRPGPRTAPGAAGVADRAGAQRSDSSHGA